MARGSLKTPNDFGAVAVIDGKTVKVTPLRTANVPPPMALFDIDVPSTVIDVVFSQDNSTMAVLHHAGVDKYVWQTQNERSLRPRWVGRYLFSSEELAGSALQISFASHCEPCVLYFQDGLKICSLTQNAGSESLVARDVVMPAEEVILMQTSIHLDTLEDGNPAALYAQNTSGTLLCLAHGGFHPLNAGFPMQLPWVEIAEVGGDLVAFGLSRSGHLYADSRLLIKNCTSFLVTPRHLVLTTSNHFLKFVHLERIVQGELATHTRTHTHTLSLSLFLVFFCPLRKQKKMRASPKVPGVTTEPDHYRS